MTLTDTLLRRGIETAKPLLDRFGILASPIRGLVDARRVLTVDRPMDSVRAVLLDPAQAPVIFGGPAAVEGEGAGGDRSVVFRLPDRGRASLEMRPGRNGGTELVLDVHLDRVTDHGRPRYGQNAGVVALRVLHRVKSLVETGEVATLAHNPTTRPAPDPYGD
jgi:hypothetical protein